MDQLGGLLADDDVNLSDMDALGDLDMSDSDVDMAGVEQRATQSEANIDEYDKALAAMIRLRKQKLTENKELKRQNLHFKLRVLDLIEIFMKHQSKNPLTLLLFSHLLNALAAARASVESKPLYDRIVSLYKNKLCKPKEYPTASLEEGEGDWPMLAVSDLLTELSTRAKKTAHRDGLSLISQACLHMARVLAPDAVQQQDQKEEEKTQKKTKKTKKSDKSTSVSLLSHPLSPQASLVVASYQDSLKFFLAKKHSNLNTKFFQDFILRFPLLGIELVPDLLVMSTAACSQFLKGECFLLLNSVLKFKAVLLRSCDVKSLADLVNSSLTENLRDLITDHNEPGDVKEEEESKKSKKSGGSKLLVKRVKVALKFANNYVTLVKSAEQSDKALSSVSGGELVATMEELPSSLVQQLKGLLYNFARNAGIEVELQIPTKSNKPKKKKNQNEERNLKKAARANKVQIHQKAKADKKRKNAEPETETNVPDKKEENGKATNKKNNKKKAKIEQ